MIPREISTESVLKAITYIDHNGVLKLTLSRFAQIAIK